MNVLELKRFEQIEEIIGTVHKAFPHLPKRPRRLLTEATPYLTFVIACVLVFAASAPFFGIKLPLFLVNIFLLQTVFVLCAVVLLSAFKSLSLWMKKGWYTLFYVSLIQLLLTLMFFSIYTFVAQIVVWYVLFEIKKEYT